MDCESGIIRLHLHKEGGLSEIFKSVRQEDSKFLAVKVLKNGATDPMARAFWEKEVECLSTLKHPNIVTMIGASATATDFKIVLEWLDETLADWLQLSSFRFVPQTWLNMSREIISAMSYAHSKNIAHRDIKPENILFRNSGTARELVIVDFGIGRVEESRNRGETVASYRSPIFAPADHDSRDPYSRDVYSVAAVLVQMLTSNLFKEPLDIFKQLQTSREQSTIPIPILEFLEKSLSMDPDHRPKNLIDFRTQFESIVKPFVTPRSLTPVYVVLTKKVRDQLNGRPSISSHGVVEKFDQILNSAEVYGRVEQDRKGESDELSIYLTTNEWSVVCKTKDFNTPVPFLLAVEAKQPLFDDIDRWRDNAVPLSKKFKFQLLEDTYSAKPNLGSKELASHLSRANPEFSTNVGDNDWFDTWSRVLDAKREFALGKFKPMEYREFRNDAGYFVFDVSPLPEGDLSQSIWQISGLEGCTFEVSHVDTDGLWANSSRPSVTPPASGKLELALGADGASFNRQRDAVAKLKSDLNSEDAKIAKSIERPNLVSPLDEIVEYPPIMGNIDEDKRRAVSGALSSNDLFVVEGPPGTGKTNFIAELVLQILKANPFAKILLTAQTHVAVDNAMSRLHQQGLTNMLRIGNSDRGKMDKEIKGYLVEHKIRNWKDEINLKSTKAITDIVGRAGADIQLLKKLLVLRELHDLLRLKNQKELERVSRANTSLSNTVKDGDLRQFEFDLAHLDESINKVTEKISGSAPSQRAFELGGQFSLETVANQIASIEESAGYSSGLVDLINLQSGWVSKLPTDRDLQSRMIRRSSLVAGTCVGVIREPAVREMEFDFCIIDEASKATATEALVPISFSKKVLLVGDYRQLPPNEEEFLQQKELLESNGLSIADVKTTLFDHVRLNINKSKISSLWSQYRMSRPIGDLVSKCFYEGKLISVNSHQLIGYSECVGKQVRWISTSSAAERGESRHPNGSYVNRYEAQVIASEVKQLIDLVEAEKLGSGKEMPEILIVSMYLAQKQAIQDALNRVGAIHSNIRIETADAVQGTEADIVYVSVTRSNPQNKIGFLDRPNWRRINVALSRAKFALSIVGDANFVSNTDGGLAVALNYIAENKDDCELEMAR